MTKKITQKKRLAEARAWLEGSGQRSMERQQREHADRVAREAGLLANPKSRQQVKIDSIDLPAVYAVKPAEALRRIIERLLAIPSDLKTPLGGISILEDEAGRLMIYAMKLGMLNRDGSAWIK